MKKMFTLALLLAASTVSAFTPKIYQGELANPAEFESSVGLSHGILHNPERLPSLSCSGTLIAPSWILTAGHCVTMTGNRNLEEQLQQRPTYAAIGGGNMFTGEGVQIRKVDMAILGSDYKAWCDSHADEEHCGFAYYQTKDFALLRLEQPSTKPWLPMASDAEIANAVATSKAVTIAGRGKNDDVNTPELYGILFKADVTVCDFVNDGRSDTMNEHHICTNFTEASSICFGDSGGGLYADGKVWGANSWTTTAGDDCSPIADGMPSGIGRLDVAEINQIMAANPPEQIANLRSQFQYAAIVSGKSLTVNVTADLPVTFSVTGAGSLENVTALGFKVRANADLNGGELITVTATAGQETLTWDLTVVKRAVPMSRGLVTGTCTLYHDQAESGHSGKAGDMKFTFDDSVVDDIASSGLYPFGISNFVSTSSKVDVSGLVQLFGSNNQEEMEGIPPMIAWYNSTAHPTPGSSNMTSTFLSEINGEWIHSTDRGYGTGFFVRFTSTADGEFAGENAAHAHWSMEKNGGSLRASGWMDCTLTDSSNQYDLIGAKATLQARLDALIANNELLQGDPARLQQYIDDATNEQDINWTTIQIDAAHQAWFDAQSNQQFLDRKAELIALLNETQMMDDDKVAIGNSINSATSIAHLDTLVNIIETAHQRWLDNQEMAELIAEQTRLVNVLENTTMSPNDEQRLRRLIASSTSIQALMNLHMPERIEAAHQAWVDFEKLQALGVEQARLSALVDLAEMSEMDRADIRNVIANATTMEALNAVPQMIADAVQRFIDEQSQEQKDRIARLQALLTSELNAAEIDDTDKVRLEAAIDSVTSDEGAAEFRAQLAKAVQDRIARLDAERLEQDRLEQERLEQERLLGKYILDAKNGLYDMINGSDLDRASKNIFKAKVLNANTIDALNALKIEIQTAIDAIPQVRTPKGGSGSVGFFGLFMLLFVRRFKK